MQFNMIKQELNSFWHLLFVIEKQLFGSKSISKPVTNNASNKTKTYVTVPSKRNNTGGCNLERKCALMRQIAHFPSKLRPPVSLLLLGKVTYIV